MVAAATGSWLSAEGRKLWCLFSSFILTVDCSFTNSVLLEIYFLNVMWCLPVVNVGDGREGQVRAVGSSRYNKQGSSLIGWSDEVTRP